MKITSKTNNDITIQTMSEFEAFLLDPSINIVRHMIRIPDEKIEAFQQLLNSTDTISRFRLKKQVNRILREGSGRHLVSSRTPHYWMSRGYSREEAESKISDRQSSLSHKGVECRQICPKKYEGTSCKSVKYWTKKGYSEAEAKKIISKSQCTFSLQKCVEKHGKEKGTAVWQNRQQKWLKSLLDKPEEELERLFKSRGRTKLQMVEKYGAEKTESICKSRITTYDVMLANHGKVRADEWLANRLTHAHSINPKKVSKISLELFTELLKHDIRDKQFALYGDTELHIKLPNKKFYLYDFSIHSPTAKKVIEFNGDFIHANPKKYSPGWFHPLKKITAKEIWERDERKQKTVELWGFDCMVIWESDFRADRRGTVEKCLKFLNE